jgi:tetratricopeptide (TPR) repeat protein
MSRKDRRAGSGAPAIGGGPPARSADHLFDLAVAHHQSGRLAEAESLYRDSLTLDPNHADSLNCLGILAHQCGRNDAALELIGRAIAAQERNPQYHYNIALVLAASGRMDDAVNHNRRAIALKPDYTDAHTNLASALASQGKWSEAEVHFRRTLSQSPQSPQAYGNLAGALQAQASRMKRWASLRAAWPWRRPMTSKQYLRFAFRNSNRSQKSIGCGHWSKARSCRPGLAPAISLILQPRSLSKAIRFAMPSRRTIRRSPRPY